MKFKDMPYERIDFSAMSGRLHQLMEAFSHAGSFREQWKIHEKYYQLYDHVYTMMALAQARNAIDMTDRFYEAEQAHYDRYFPAFQSEVVSYQKLLMQSPFRPEFEEKIGRVAFRNMELREIAYAEKLVPLMQEENALASGYNKLLAEAKIPWKGETLNLSLMTPYLHHNDRELRREAWEAYTRFFVEHQEELDDYYDKLVHNRTRQGQLLGDSDYLRLGYARMNRNAYSAGDVAEFRKQVKQDLVPFAEKLHERRRRRLGLSRLYYFDEGVYFHNGNPAPTGTPEQILLSGQKMYRELSPETGKFMDAMMEMDLFDVLGRKTKKTGGYMEMLPDYHMPFIFANFNGSSGDADVITHECGHAFQGYLTAGDPIHEHNDLTMEIAETHSMSMEFFTEPWINLFFGERAGDYINMHFEDAVSFIPYGTMVDEFQHIVYKNPNFTPRERNQVWRELEREYKPHLDYTGNAYLEQGGFWQKQHHIYDNPLYYIDYCIAGTNALQYKAWMDRDYRSAWESYLNLCHLSASMFFPELVKTAGLKNPLEDGCLRDIVSQMENGKQKKENS